MAVLSMSANITRRLFTFEECLRMAETGILSSSERVELIDGELLVMSPIGTRHGAAVNAAVEAIIERAAKRVIVWTQTDVVLHQFAAPQPDIALLLRREDFYRTRHPGPADILLIIEVADSSLEFDMTVKLGLYAIMGISEYWVADLQNHRLLAHSKPEGDKYAVVREHHRGDSIAPLLLPDCSIPVDVLLPADSNQSPT
jgi:Uma2 family endonuclease